ncbi:TPA: hypothetical protein DIU27_04755 [Candidatus Collierbacteria bacterium]|uniref:Uncharacterized protein n=1 Tax=Candidatus Collierbacteria bacterium GW2011_GWB2_44_22 TaxID=1618387 RepID=A0A0G1HXV8_9BACT|nr:MAG: hypothetical protein UW31_C0016G0010 [Candidatus Collierbacteria bacterium GW2011_GWA2_44_13]KKT51775.1 MAG: hypothetical protein UW44_C0008G0097 [Candidatus Collierbacteria bacterium GW2011_GWB2_44_22]KKT65470.1 MAG: hypothetical protein UW58_C0029G0010 [Candidatus Collierbacteria bacterium GW2011_GWC2_44_30]KKT68311.1 MAG: hypothetical protein UW64_C0023G0027 [Microgenomates group bacterium GW2011_GWC1_44_37]KKT87998.1 MAG: hypothetical protein UW88_C0017G0019 [Candidatus Collierbacte
MAFYVTSALKLDGDFGQLIETLVHMLPEDHNNVTILLYADHFYKDDGGKFRGMPIRFVQATTENVAGMVRLGFGKGVFESFKIPPPGVLGME